jgi:formate hydrogenlyase subunit 3/multisubunit Na+/H+ antiporter MnhD subunit
VAGLATALVITLVFFFAILLVRQDSLVAMTLPYVALLTLVSLVFFFVKSYFVMFLLFEVLLLLSLGLLRLTSKSERVGEAISEMFL